jgi:hypothetical protein
MCILPPKKFRNAPTEWGKTIRTPAALHRLYGGKISIGLHLNSGHSCPLFGLSYALLHRAPLILRVGRLPANGNCCFLAPPRTAPLNAQGDASDDPKKPTGGEVSFHAKQGTRYTDHDSAAIAVSVFVITQFSIIFLIMGTSSMARQMGSTSAVNRARATRAQNQRIIVKISRVTMHLWGANLALRHRGAKVR